MWYIAHVAKWCIAKCSKCIRSIGIYIALCIHVYTSRGNLLCNHAYVKYSFLFLQINKKLRGKTAIHVACTEGYLGCLKVLLSYQPDLEIIVRYPTDTSSVACVIHTLIGPLYVH